MFVKPDGFNNKSTSIVINHDDIVYRIFINDDIVTCFYCKLKGHISNQCPNLKTTSDETSNNSLEKTIDENMEVDNKPTSESNKSSITKPLTTKPSLGIKRPAPFTSSLSPSSPTNKIPNSSNNHTETDISENENIGWKTQSTKKQKKRKRTSSLEYFIANLNESLRPAEKFCTKKNERFHLFNSKI